MLMSNDQSVRDYSWPWRGYLAFCILLVLILVGGIYSLWVSSTINKQAERENLAADLAQALSGAEFIADHQKGLLDRLRAIALRGRFVTAFEKSDFLELRSVLNPLVQTNPEIKTVFLANEKGQVFLGLPHLVDKEETIKGLPLQTPKPWVSFNLLGLEKGRPSLTAFSVPIKNKQEKIIGYLGLTQKGSVWKDFFARISARPGRTFLLYDQRRKLVAAGKNASKLLARDISVLSDPTLLKGMENERPWAGIVEGAEGKAFVTAAIVPGLNWLLVVAQDYDAAMRSSRAMGENIVFFLVLLLLCLFLLGFMLLSRYRVQQQVLARLGGEVEKRTADLAYTTEQYRSLVEDLPDIVYEIDAQGVYTFLSNSVYSVLGYHPEEMVGRLRRDSVHRADRHKFDEEWKRGERGEEISILALRHLHKNGSVRWLSVHSRGIFMPSGQVIGRRGVARDVTKQVLAEKRVRELSRKLISTQEEERKRIALDLHDEMGQMLSALKIGLQALAKREESRDSEELARLIRLTQVVMDQIRALAHRLRPSILDNFGLKAALEDLCETLAESELLEVVYNLEDLPKERISPEMEISLFRVAQEALTNVLKHSQSERVEVRLEKDTDRVRLIVEDQGVGFDLDQALEDGKRLGLLGMEERIGLLGGHLSINTGEKGTTILAEVSVG